MNDHLIVWLREALSVPYPFPWQIELLGRMSRGEIERALDLPTGLGKTAVMAIWLIARTQAPTLPRRLVYVVDRRAVVDQATEEAHKLRSYVERTPALKEALGLSRALPISTLRGQFVDNKDWLEDPSSPAIIVGTVDMTGSRLLFEGYGTSRKMRPYQAGLLGSDTLFVIDEAHLVPPFEKLLEAIESGGDFGPKEGATSPVPSLRLLSLSATGRATNRKPFELQPEDLDNDTVQRRLNASKQLSIIEQPPDITLAQALASKTWDLADGKASSRLIVFCNKREDAKSARESLLKTAHSNKVKVEAELLVGGRRVFERTEATSRLKTLGFVAGSTERSSTPAFLFATSAGEVGIDLDADHMVGDIVAWERMVQRLGRVNRRGDGKATVVLIAEQPSKDLLKAAEKEEEKRTEKDRELLRAHEQNSACRELLQHLPGSDTNRDASPSAFGRLKRQATTDERIRKLLAAATTPSPLYPALTRALVDAWSMTSLKDHSGRPEIAPWLRGWVDEQPQTSVLWRRHLPIKTNGTASPEEVEGYFEAAPPHTSEVLETETYRVYEWLSERALALQATSQKPKTEPLEEGNSTARLKTDDVIAFLLSPALELRTQITVAELLPNDGLKKRQDLIQDALRGGILIVDARVGGLVAGLLDTDSDDPPRCADDGQDWLKADDTPVLGFRVDETETLPLDLGVDWRERYRFAATESDAGTGRWLIVSKWIADAATEEDRSEGYPQLLREHHEWTAGHAGRLADRLNLSAEYRGLLVLAARLHDEGKASAKWQRAFNAKKDGVYAKTRGPLNVALLDGYRHELGSILSAGVRNQLNDLPDDLRDLAYHLIASHHGFARPLIRARGCDLPPSRLEDETRHVALRYLRLQKRWGPWGLAWWEALIRAADQRASRDNDMREKGVESNG